MTTPSLDAQIDALYALPLEAFTASRNALAKHLKGDPDAVARVKALTKPSQVPWAVNLLYWNDRSAWSRLLDAGRALRAAQLDALGGSDSDVRSADAAHRAALTDAVSAATRLAAQAGGSAASDPLTRMLEALSLAHDLPPTPGRYTDLVQPAGFEALSGLSFGSLARVITGPPPPGAPRAQLEAAHHSAVAARERVADASRRADASLALADAQVQALRAQLERSEVALAAARAAAATASRELAEALATEADAERRLRNA